MDAAELVSEIESFKFQAAELLTHQAKATPVDLLQLIHSYDLQEVYPNIQITRRIFLALPVTVETCERSFSKLKLIKNYHRSTMGQKRLRGLAVISTKREISANLDYDDVVVDTRLQCCKRDTSEVNDSQNHSENLAYSALTF